MMAYENEEREYEIVVCPVCGEPAELRDRYTLLDSEGGSVSHISTFCVMRHYYNGLLGLDTMG